MTIVTQHADVMSADQTIEIPGTAFVPCPAMEFKQTRVARCPQCQHFKGFVDTIPRIAQSVEFTARYRVFCGHAIARRMAHVETG